MRDGSTIAVVIPAFNEEQSVGKVIGAIPRWVDDVVVADNGSTDRTAAVARSCGARVVAEPKRGYGSACLAGIAALRGPDVVVFLDADFSDHPHEMARLVDPIVAGRAEMVIGSRARGERERGALLPQARFGNWLACALMRLFWRARYTDLGPFRAIRRDALERLDMRDRDYGWTVEMQVKAAQRGLKTLETPVSYRKRVGKSKISGTVRGVVAAGTKILFTIFRAALCEPYRTGGPVRDRLVVFTRYPEPGTTKTRLIPALGPRGAARLQRRMTARMLEQARALSGRRPVTVDVRFEGGNELMMCRCFGSGYYFRPQGWGDLGARMLGAFADGFTEGAARVVIVGTDCPGITADLVGRALDALAENDLVLGPATDGGYYLIGLRRVVPELFKGVPWGTAEVLERTLKIAEGRGLSFALLDPLDDVDRPEDLPIVQREMGLKFLEGRVGTISIVIPTWNEAGNVDELLAELAGDSALEIIIADGGSTDGTPEAAASRGVRVVRSPRGKAVQMNAGAAVASGQILLFLHADTRLPCNFQQHVREALATPGAVAGAFEPRLSARSPGLRLIERLTSLRSRRLGMPYGDQAIFMRSELFSEIGGFPQIPIMEDFALMRDLGRRGRIVIVPAPAVTSARRWLALGTLRTTLVNQAVIAAYCLGVSPARLAGWYGRRGNNGGSRGHSYNRRVLSERSGLMEKKKVSRHAILLVVLGVLVPAAAVWGWIWRREYADLAARMRPRPRLAPSKVFEREGRRYLRGGREDHEHFDITGSRLEPELLNFGDGRERFAALIEPEFEPARAADEWLIGSSRILGINIGGDVRVYPVDLLRQHEVVNDVVGGRPVFACYCPVADFGAVYERTMAGHTFTFGVSGYTYSDRETWGGKDGFVLWDRDTESLWWPLINRGVAGPAIDQPMKQLEGSQWEDTTWAEFRAKYPDCKVLSQGQDFERPKAWPRYTGPLPPVAPTVAQPDGGDHEQKP